MQNSFPNNKNLKQKAKRCQCQFYVRIRINFQRLRKVLLLHLSNYVLKNPLRYIPLLYIS